MKSPKCDILNISYTYTIMKLTIKTYQELTILCSNVYFNSSNNKCSLLFDLKIFNLIGTLPGLQN